MDKYIKYEDIQECRFFQDERGEWILHADIIKIPAADVAPVRHGRMTAHDSRRAIDKLATYEDAEEQGRLVILPCKVGDTLYAPTRNIVSEFRVSQFDFGGYEKSYLWVNWYLTKGITGNFRIDGIRASEIGKTVFLSREEAEAALKGERDDV